MTPSDFLNSHSLPPAVLPLLETAFTHKSLANDRGLSSDPAAHNQRLEFLGDAVLGLVIASALFEMHPEADEGFLTREKARSVSAPTLLDISRNLELQNYLQLGKGEKVTGGEDRGSGLSDCLEAIIGAIYLGAGFERASDFIREHWREYLQGKVASGSEDFKSRLQEIFIRRFHKLPEYQVISTTGPDHSRIYEIVLKLGSREVARGTGPSRKKAEQAAAEFWLRNNF